MAARQPPRITKSAPESPSGTGHGTFRYLARFPALAAEGRCAMFPSPPCPAAAGACTTKARLSTAAMNCALNCTPRPEQSRSLLTALGQANGLGTRVLVQVLGAGLRVVFPSRWPRPGLTSWRAADCASASAACSQCPLSQALNADRLRSVAAGVIWPVASPGAVRVIRDCQRGDRRALA